MARALEYDDLGTDPGELTNVFNDGAIGNERPHSVLTALAERSSGSPMRSFRLSVNGCR